MIWNIASYKSQYNAFNLNQNCVSIYCELRCSSICRLGNTMKWKKKKPYQHCSKVRTVTFKSLLIDLHAEFSFPFPIPFKLFVKTRSDHLNLRCDCLDYSWRVSSQCKNSTQHLHFGFVWIAKLSDGAKILASFFRTSSRHFECAVCLCMGMYVWVSISTMKWNHKSANSIL